MLKPQDIVILLKILAMITLIKEESKEELTQLELAAQLCMSASEIHAGIKRLQLAGLLGFVFLDKNGIGQKKKLQAVKKACEECLIYGVKYFFPAQVGGHTPGIVTSYAAPIFKNQILINADAVPVWPYAEGKQRGLALEPLYRAVPKSIMKYPDPVFYGLLTLVDAIRSGRARERELAIKLLLEKLNNA